MRYSIIGLLLLLVACSKKEDDPIVYSSVPAIQFVSTTATSVKEGDGVTFKIAYTDGDGDLGENDPNKYNLFVEDNRVPVIYKYRIQQLAPSSSNITIKGNVNIELNSISITDGSSSQTVSYSIYVLDRAGNKSNVVTSSTISVSE